MSDPNTYGNANASATNNVNNTNSTQSDQAETVEFQSETVADPITGEPVTVAEVTDTTYADPTAAQTPATQTTAYTNSDGSTTAYTSPYTDPTAAQSATQAAYAQTYPTQGYTATTDYATQQNNTQYSQQYNTQYTQNPYTQNGQPAQNTQYTQQYGYTQNGSHAYAPIPAGYIPRNKILAGVLAFVLGMIGIHNFYLGFTGKAVAQVLLSCLGWIVFGLGPIAAMIWAIVEGVQILTSNYGTPAHRDARGVELVD